MKVTTIPSAISSFRPTAPIGVSIRAIGSATWTRAVVPVPAFPALSVQPEARVIVSEPAEALPVTAYLYVFPETSVGVPATVRPASLIVTLPLSEPTLSVWPGTGMKVTTIPSLVRSAGLTVPVGVSIWATAGRR